MCDEIADLVVVGAGYAGINALWVARSYLPKNANVVVLDKRDNYGGNWLDQYSFVTLHQPHKHFTAGNRPWTLQKPREYLAKRDEVIEHLQACASDCAQSFDLRPQWKTQYEGYAAGPDAVSVSFIKLDDRGATQQIKTKRLILCTGFDIQILQPLRLASSSVVSMSVVDERLSEPLSDGASLPPVFVVGSGKTAMDTVLSVARNQPGRRIEVIGGRGTYFFNRDACFPTGMKRVLPGAGPLFNDYFSDIALRYSAGNGKELWQELSREGLLHSPAPDPEVFMVGLLGTAELAAVKQAVSTFHKAYLRDVKDTPEGPALQLEDPTTKALSAQVVPPGSVIVNCTSHILAHPCPVAPLLSACGRVCAPQKVLVFTGASAYAVTHLFLQGKLADCAHRFRQFDWLAVPKDNFAALVASCFYANFLNLYDCLSLKILLQLEGNYDKWWPLHRQLPAMARLLSRRSRLIAVADEYVPDRYPSDRAGDEPVCKE